MIVVVGGPPGSGKTTVAERFAKAHAYAFVSAGAKFREQARERGLSLAEFGALAQKDYAIDRALDHSVFEETLRQDAVGRDVVVEGRIQAYLLKERRVPCLKVLIDARLEVRAKRIGGREGKSATVARKEITAREHSERTRYKAIYGIDVADRSVYDLIIDSSDKTPEDVVAAIAARVGG